MTLVLKMESGFTRKYEIINILGSKFGLDLGHR